MFAGLLYVGASINYGLNGKWLLMVAFIGYALANFALMKL